VEIFHPNLVYLTTFEFIFRAMHAKYYE